MSSDQSLFLSAIAASPEDDLPRLVYADWLDEHGDPDRAELIRIQIAKYRTKEEKRYPRPLKERIKQLFDLHRARWDAQLPVIPGVEWGRYWRGFVSEAKFANPMSFIEQADTVFATMPIRIVQLSGLEHEHGFDICRVLHNRELYGLRLDTVSLNLDLWQQLTAHEWFRSLYQLIVFPADHDRRDAGSTRDRELVQMIVTAATRSDSQIRKMHLDLECVERREIVQNRIILTGLGGYDNWWL